ncbi:MAG: adenosylmethionine--8-amino-7-oxononanoate transaminase [Lentisphaeria bacterium]|nr:adenosylmethionine--8-amino-7-oxononanoate transaminase [Lentisphaeria bacterium]
MDKQDTLAFDKQHLWHPYSSFTNPTPVFDVVRAEGVYLELGDGRKVIDGMSSWWCAIHGYNHPVLNEAIHQQLDKMAHVMFGGLTHQPAVELGKRLISILPQNLNRIFYADSGSVSVEVAMKMAIQYWYSKGLSNKNRFATVRGGYHGDTTGPMSVCDPVNGMHHMFRSILPEYYFVDRPVAATDDYFDISEMNQLRSVFEKHHAEIAAFIIEPILQGAGGMRFMAPQYVLECRKLCDEFDILMICDEIATGFGRTGSMLAIDQVGIVPDLLCLGKALTGGYMSFAATIASSEIANIISESEAGTFMHGPTFMGNPLACSVACASFDLLHAIDWRTNVIRIETQLKKGLLPLKNESKVADVRVKGAVGVLELKENVDMKTLQPWLLGQGVWLRPFGKLLYTMPPYIINNDEIDKITKVIAQAVQ